MGNITFPIGNTTCCTRDLQKQADGMPCPECEKPLPLHYRIAPQSELDADPKLPEKWRISDRCWKIILFIILFIIFLILLLAGLTLWRYYDRLHNRYPLMKPFMDVVSTSQPCHEPLQPKYMPVPAPGVCQAPCRLNFGEEAPIWDIDPQINPLWGFLYTNVADADMVMLSHMLAGAFVEFVDPYACGYKFLTGLPGAYTRDSGHQSIDTPVGVVEGTVINSILIGNKEGGITWFQLEGSNFDFRNPGKIFSNPLSFIRHITDSTLYFFLNKQMGPLGQSLHVESNPVRALKYIPHRARCPNSCVVITTPPPGVAAPTPPPATAGTVNVGVQKNVANTGVASNTMTAQQSAAAAQQATGATVVTR